ncbi:fimbrial biogenesis chaperone [Rhodalgimonas zhirmunskyi]|uniref:Fimbria/pilus periplasmic chaperone n=1 Tax=Rhodalgimonas zhirmunskyi TaxID=2964767 RepID=A0AAJ1U7G5_9RHOB|nr:fimbria/pilus periplasmic chaperone [Rhodoalgimonas zhirmunskyi]MDQ2092703.1 fimbria/pilus periplasmic chaperone [Rhodoalgimonas zhirmunskyi]
MIKHTLKKTTACTVLAAGLILAPMEVSAESVAVSPTRLNVPNKGQQTTLTVKAGGKQASVVQLRVVKWDGRDPDNISPTRDVVVSPPMANLRPRQELTVRVLRTKKRAVRGKECYRVLVDRLPGKEQSGQAVKLQVRHSVPLCFTS